MSSCQKSIITEDEARALREEEIHTLSKEFLRGVITNLCIPEGLSGSIDVAFGIERQPLLVEVLKELVKELEEENGT